MTRRGKGGKCLNKAGATHNFEILLNNKKGIRKTKFRKLVRRISNLIYQETIVLKVLSEL